MHLGDVKPRIVLCYAYVSSDVQLPRTCTKFLLMPVK